MKNVGRGLFFLLVFLGVSLTATSQDVTSLHKKAEEIIKAKNSSWKLIRRQERDKEITSLWGPEKADVMLTIFYGVSEQEAADRMKAAIDRLSMGPGKKRSDIGDEACFWKSETVGFAAIRFRKANVFVEVSAPSASVVEDLARSIALQIQKN